jgi:hypothetical protein
VIRRASSASRCCVMGREQFLPGNVTCISCRRQEVPCPFGALVPVPAPAAAPVEEKAAPKAKEPNKTEAEYGRRLSLEFPGCEVRYEALALIIELDGERFRYSPDWVVLLPGGGVLCIEVKNAGYQHASYGRAKLAFAAARVAWPMFSFRWAEKESGSWDVKDFDRVGSF